MDLFLSILKSVIYGVIEGITEWLPISSTGHMILAEQVLKFGYTEDFMEMFRVVIQLGAILAVVVLYFHKLWPFCKDNGRDTGFAAHLRWPVVRLWFKIIAACVPAAVLGILLDVSWQLLMLGCLMMGAAALVGARLAQQDVLEPQQQ
ncbi:MAG TPA: undecaprenyl-diphosphate phosphatase, partial [Gemmiger qucibialis]|nr:undecaprenyl-diphosphate phosphatase [Gemmiger qucibialis]